jgi:hypothetical protein
MMLLFLLLGARKQILCDENDATVFSFFGRHPFCRLVKLLLTRRVDNSTSSTRRMQTRLEEGIPSVHELNYY